MDLGGRGVAVMLAAPAGAGAYSAKVDTSPAAWGSSDKPSSLAPRRPAGLTSPSAGGSANPTQVTPALDLSPYAAKLPTGTDLESKARRDKLFDRMDNGNGYLSLSEVTEGVLDVLAMGELYDAKPAIMRAFQAAKGVDLKTKATGGMGGDFVERSEFRLLLVYLKSYFELYQVFSTYDSSHDSRIGPDEFAALAQSDVVRSWGINVSNPEAEFARADSNAGGYILFDEFCTWILQKRMQKEAEDMHAYDV